MVNTSVVSIGGREYNLGDALNITLIRTTLHADAVVAHHPLDAKQDRTTIVGGIHSLPKLITQQTRGFRPAKSFL